MKTITVSALAKAAAKSIKDVLAELADAGIEAKNGKSEVSVDDLATVYPELDLDTIESPPAPKTTKLFCFESRAGGLSVHVGPTIVARFSNHTYNTTDPYIAEQLQKAVDVRLVEVHTIDEKGNTIDVDRLDDEKAWRIRAVVEGSDYDRALQRGSTRFSTKQKAEKYRAEVLNDEGENYDIIFQRGK